MKNRICPECKQRGIPVAELQPHGTQCRYCAKHIEVDAIFGILCVASLTILTVLDFNYWHLDFVGLISVALLIINAVAYQAVNARVMPLKHYKDETSL